MNLTYFDILKAVATGQMTPEMSFFDRQRAESIRNRIKKAKPQSEEAAAVHGDGSQIDDLTTP